VDFQGRREMLEDASWRVLVCAGLSLGSAASIVIGQSVEKIGDGCFRRYGKLVGADLGFGAVWMPGICVWKAHGRVERSAGF
jgi:hypothetical protein